jgi:uncharacterized protein (TIGR02217 family)
MAFHEERFPTGVSFGSSGGPERRTEIVTLASGYEQRNSAWADSRRRYNAGYGIKSLNDIHAVIAFFEARHGRLHGFRWKDFADFRSCPPQTKPTPTDQLIEVGDGTANEFFLIKSYRSGAQSYTRKIAKPVVGTVRIAVDGTELAEGIGMTVDATTGRISLAQAPRAGTFVTAGFEFDVPVRFDTDFLDISLAAFQAGQIPNIPIVEIRL